MEGTIRNRDVLVHTITILRYFGLVAYIRCVRSMVRCVVRKEASTFLDALYSQRPQG
jgi:hypothetical protein